MVDDMDSVDCTFLSFGGKEYISITSYYTPPGPQANHTAVRC